MQLSDLFSVYNELPPEVSTETDVPLKSYLQFQSPLKNIERVREVIPPTNEDGTENAEEEEITTESTSPAFSWITTTYSRTKPQDVQDIQKRARRVAQTSKTTTFIPKSNKSRDLLQYLKEKEGFRSTVYQDSGGVPTIGYGFTAKDLINKGTITEQEASQILQQEIDQRREKLKQQITNWDNLTQNQRDALVSYGYNVGVENWKINQPKLLAALNSGNYNEAVKYIDAVRDREGNVLQGLVKRRQEERDWFVS